MHGLAVVSRTGKVGIGEEDNQSAQGVFIYGIAADALEYAFEFFVVFSMVSKASSISFATPENFPPQGNSAPVLRIETSCKACQRAEAGTQNTLSAV